MTILAYIHLQEKKTVPVKYADRTRYHVDRATKFREPTVKPGKKKENALINTSVKTFTPEIPSLTYVAEIQDWPLSY